MRTLIFIGTFLSCLFINAKLSAQLDIKTNTHGLIFDQRVDMSLEFKLGKKFTLEPSIGLSWQPLVLTSSNFADPFFESFRYGELRPAVFFKVYPMERFDYRGFHFGAHLDSEIELFRDDQYDVEFFNQLGFSPERESFRKLGIGSFVAYKWILWDHWVIQPMVVVVDLDLYTLFKSRVFAVSSHARLMLGYQF